MPIYRFTYDDRFLIETLERQRSVSAERFGRYALKTLCAVGVLALLALTIYIKAVLLALFFGGLLVLLSLGPRFDYWYTKRQFRKSPFYGTDTVVEIGPHGYSMVNPQAKMELSWQVIAKVRRLKDGFLLFFGQRTYLWCPDRALSEGTVGDVESIIKQNVPDAA